MTPAAANWSKPYHGVSHFGRMEDQRYATLTEWSDTFDVVFWSRHLSLFQSPEMTFDTLSDARAAAEAWTIRAQMPAELAAR